MSIGKFNWLPEHDVFDDVGAYGDSDLPLWGIKGSRVDDQLESSGPGAHGEPRL